MNLKMPLLVPARSLTITTSAPADAGAVILKCGGFRMRLTPSEARNCAIAFNKCADRAEAESAQPLVTDWTARETATFLRMWKADLTADAIAAHLHRPIGQVNARAAQFGFRLRRVDRLDRLATTQNAHAQ